MTVCVVCVCVCVVCVCVCVQALVRVCGVQSGVLPPFSVPCGPGSNRKSICDAGYDDAPTDPHLGA